MMPKPHPPCPAEFRQQIVELFHAGRFPDDLARELGGSAQTVRNWVRAAGGDTAARPRSKPVEGGALTNAERKELVQLRRQLRQMRMERDILAKATT